jgi:transcription termination factor Rho
MALGSIIAFSGCRPDAPAFEVVTLEGKIEKIDRTSAETGEITVLYYSEKHGQEMLGTGLVTRETEIMINGALVKLSDLREGDRVRGEVRVERKRGGKARTALKIYVVRPLPIGQGG